MTADDWDQLAHLDELVRTGKASAMGRVNYGWRLEATRDEDEHPEDYEGPCLCRLCCSYGD